MAFKDKEKEREYKHQWYEAHKEELRERSRESARRYREAHRERVRESVRKYQKTHPESQKEWCEKYPEKYKASRLAQAYKQNDKKYGRGECTITKQWILDNIFTSKCYYCGETDWRELGCDRINNTKPHTPDNVVCSCMSCNRKRGTMPFEEFVKQQKEMFYRE